jgi:hypothetical protein
MEKYASLQFWGDELQKSVSACVSSWVADVLLDYNITTCNGVRDLAARCIDELTNNRIPTTQDATSLWQISQCLKKFRYGGAPSPEEMMAGWVQRNQLCGHDLDDPPEWLIDRASQLLEPLGPAYELSEADGRFGNGAVYERWNSIARWNRLIEAPYDPRDPDDIRWWRESSALSARLCCVPKDMFKLRSITVEPSEATFLQQRTRSRLIAAAARVLDRRSAIPQQLFGAGPEMQRRRALSGSLTGRLATIDLSDASDSVRWDLVQRMFPKNIVADLERSRSPYCDVNGVRHRVHMYAGMGNATTFIVETLYFWSLCTALSTWLRDLTPVSVFGDDIVLSCKSARHPLFLENLAKLGIRVNMEKSGLSEGPGFREACGLAAYCGCELPLLRCRGYRVENPEELVSLCGWVNTALEPDSRYAPFCRLMGLSIGRQLKADLQLPVLPEYPLEAGVYLVDSSEQVGDWSYRARWDIESQHPVVRCKVLRTPCKKVSSRSLTRWECLGVLSGQLRTEFHDAPAGFIARRDNLLVPGKPVLRHEWVPILSSDASLLDLSQGR